MHHLSRVAGLGALALSAGCVFAYSFESLEGGRDLLDAGSAAMADAGLDAEPSSRFCTSEAAKTADFCDDFDDGAPLGAQWNVAGTVANPLLFLDSSATLVPAEPSPLVSPPNSVRMVAKGYRAKAVLLHLLRARDGGAPTSGFEVAVAASPRRYMVEPSDSGAIRGVLMLGILTQEPGEASLGGISVMSDESTLYVGQTNDLGEEVPASERATLVPFAITGVNKSALWGRIRLAIGERSLVVARGFKCDVDASAGLVAAVETAAFQTACFALGGRFANTRWFDRAVLSVGPLILGDGEAEVLIDNVTARVF